MNLNKNYLLLKNTFKTGCEFKIVLQATTKGLKIITLNLNHNHQLNQHSFSHHPKQRKLNESDIVETKRLLGLKANKQKIRKEIMTKTGKQCTMRDIHNINYLRKKEEIKDKNEVRDICARVREQHPGTDVQFVLDDADNVTAIFLQDATMKATYAAYPEVILCDATYKVSGFIFISIYNIFRYTGVYKCMRPLYALNR